MEPSTLTEEGLRKLLDLTYCEEIIILKNIQHDSLDVGSIKSINKDLIRCDIGILNILEHIVMNGLYTHPAFKRVTMGQDYIIIDFNNTSQNKYKIRIGLFLKKPDGGAIDINVMQFLSELFSPEDTPYIKQIYKMYLEKSGFSFETYLNSFTLSLDQQTLRKYDLFSIIKNFVLFAEEANKVIEWFLPQ